jgi:DNA polymerase (family 10)
VSEGRLQELPGIGPGLARVIEELHRTGRSRLLESLRSEMPPGVLELSRLRSLTLPRIRALHDTLGLASLDAVEEAALGGRLQAVRGFGAATEARVLEEIRRWREQEGHQLLHEALEVADALVEHLRRAPGVERADLAGELRRRQERVSRLDVVAAGSTDAAVGALARFPALDNVASRDEGGATGVLASGLAVLLAWTPPPAYGTALVKHTGSEAHWRRLGEIGRELASPPAPDLGSLSVREEEQLYARLGLPFIPPELREDEGEIEAALGGTLPTDLVRREDVRGMVHCHTRDSDGRNSILQMARAVEGLGLEYLTITDHSRSAHYAGGLSIERLLRQWDEIDRARRRRRCASSRAPSATSSKTAPSTTRTRCWPGSTSWW